MQCYSSIPTYENVDNNVSSSYVKFDRTYFDGSFLSNTDILSDVNRTIDNLEQGFRTQYDIDKAYDSWCDILQMSMYSNIPYKTIQIKSDSCSRKYKPGKPW